MLDEYGAMWVIVGLTRIEKVLAWALDIEALGQSRPQLKAHVERSGVHDDFSWFRRYSRVWGDRLQTFDNLTLCHMLCIFFGAQKTLVKGLDIGVADLDSVQSLKLLHKQTYFALDQTRPL